MVTSRSSGTKSVRVSWICVSLQMVTVFLVIVMMRVTVASCNIIIIIMVIIIIIITICSEAPIKHEDLNGESRHCGDQLAMINFTICGHIGLTKLYIMICLESNDL